MIPISQVGRWCEALAQRRNGRIGEQPLALETVPDRRVPLQEFGELVGVVFKQPIEALITERVSGLGSSAYRVLETDNILQPMVGMLNPGDAHHLAVGDGDIAQHA